MTEIPKRENYFSDRGFCVDTLRQPAAAGLQTICGTAQGDA